MVLVALVFCILCFMLRGLLNSYKKNELEKQRQKNEREWLDLAKAQGPKPRASWAPPIPKQRVG